MCVTVAVAMGSSCGLLYWVMSPSLSLLQNEVEREWVVWRFEEATAQQFTQERKRETLVKLAQAQVSTTAPLGLTRH